MCGMRRAASTLRPHISTKRKARNGDGDSDGEGCDDGSCSMLSMGMTGGERDECNVLV